MRRSGKILGRAILALFVLFGAAWAMAPIAPLGREISFDASQIGPDIQAWLERREFQFSNLDPAAAKRIVWAGAKGVKTPLAIIFLHGFSATSEEIRPVPDDLAKALGANLFFTRPTGHALPGDALSPGRTSATVDLILAWAKVRRF